MNTPGRGRDGSEWDLSRLLLDNVSDCAVFALDLEGHVISWSAPAQRLLGYSEEEVLGQPAARFYSPDDVAGDVVATELREARESGRVERNRWCLRRDGSRFWSVDVTTPLLDTDGLARGFARILHDGTDSKLAQDARDDALAYVGSIVDTVREPLLVLDSGLRVRSANRAFYQTFRVSPHATEGRRLYDLGDGQWDIPRLRILLEQILPRDTVFDDYEVEHDFPGIGPRTMLLNARRLRRQNTGDELILLAIEDVTERRRAEAERQEFEARFTSLVKNVRDHSIFTLDTEGRITSWNVAAEHILGYSEEEALGRHFAFIFTVEDCAAGVPESELKAAREQGRAEDERWHLRKGGERFWALGIVSALHDAGGRLTGFSKILRDMTAWKEAEQALRSSEQRLRRMLEVDGVGVLIFDPAGTLVDSNEAFLRMSGYGRQEVATHALTWRAMTPAEHLAESERQMRLLAETGRIGPYEKEYLHKDGSRSWMLFAGTSLGDGSVVEYCVDIDDRKHAEQALRDSRRRLQSVLESIPAAVVLIDAATNRFTYMNGRAVELYGRDYLDVDLEAHLDSLEVARCDGTPFPRHELPVTRALRRGETVHDVDMIIKRADGHNIAVSVSCAPLRNSDGEMDTVIAVFDDVSSRRAAEQALEDANRRKDVFLATLAHELRNPLMPIRTGLDLLEALRGDAEACEEPLRIMDRQFDHLVHLIDDLMDLSRISRGMVELRRERLDLAESVYAALEMARGGADGGSRHLSVRVPALPLPVEGDRVRLVQVISNLLNNAVKFTDAAGHIEVRVVPQGRRVEIQVEDDGRGVEPERLDEIFEMFSQAEPGQGVGLGIGLSLVRSLVTMHGGTVAAASPGRGRGATFTVSLPLLQDAPDQPVEQDPAPTGDVVQARVLVVDDNRDIAEGLRLLLATLDTEVRVAHDGQGALRTCAGWSPTHVLMDLGMPGMDGYETARRLCAEHPDRAFRLIAVSGWGQDEDRRRAREAGFDEHLVKPVGVSALKALLAR